MEPSPKRRRVESGESVEYLVQGVTPTEDGTLWPPNRVKLLVIDGQPRISCNGSPPHGTWTEYADGFFMAYHYAGGTPEKPCMYRRIRGTEAYVQTNITHMHQTVLLPMTVMSPAAS